MSKENLRLYKYCFYLSSPLPCQDVNTVKAMGKPAKYVLFAFERVYADSALLECMITLHRHSTIISPYIHHLG